MRARIAAVSLGLAFAAALPVHAMPVATTDPVVTYGIGVILRKGNNALTGTTEVLVRSPADVAGSIATMQAVWSFGLAHEYEVHFESATGLVTTRVDIDRNQIFGSGETITASTSFNGRSFHYISMLLQELTINDLTINGTNLGTFVRGTGPQTFYWADDAVDGLFGDIDITGSIVFNPINLTSPDIPRAFFRFGDDAVYASSIPAPAVSWAFGLSLAVLGLVRRRTCKKQLGRPLGNQGSAA